MSDETVCHGDGEQHCCCEGPCPDDVETLLTRTLYETETPSGWYGQPECADVARILAPVVRDRIAAAGQQARADERERIAQAIEAQRDHFQRTTGAVGADLLCKVYDDAARIAREGGQP